MEHIYIPKNDYKVLVSCMTFNQSIYIEDSLNSFAMQQTNFSFVCLVMDDCSTDGEQDVIKAWMERECDTTQAKYAEIEKANIILVPHKTNGNCFFAFYFLKQNMYKVMSQKQKMVKPWREHCEYESHCEGDDYWIDPLKLQKQIDIMYNAPDCSIVLSNGKNLNVPTGEISLIDPLGESVQSGFISIETMLQEIRLIPTASMCIRMRYVLSRPAFFDECPVGDKPTRTWAALNGRVFYIHEPLVLYRGGAIGSFSIWSGKKKGYAKKLYMGMHKYYLALDDYTNGKYHKIIRELDEKEEFFYYKRIRNLFFMVKSRYFRKLKRKEQRIEIYNYCVENSKHAGRVLLTKLHMNWIYPKKIYK